MSTRQLAMVMDLNKCIGCQTCTVACKTQWTNRNGREGMYWNNVETKPGMGFPKKWEELGGGFDEGGNLGLRIEECGLGLAVGSLQLRA